MAKAKHGHERHPGGRGRKNPRTPQGERPLHYGTSDRSTRALRAELGEIHGSGLGMVSGGFYGGEGMLSSVQFDNSGGIGGDVTGIGAGSTDAGGTPTAPGVGAGTV